MRTAARVDSNHGAIVEALRLAGVHVRSLAAIGDGVPDLLCAVKGHTWLVEVKDGEKSPSKQKLTEAEHKFHSEWPGEIWLVTSVETAMQMLRAVRMRT
jgi:hypothetical protein